MVLIFLLFFFVSVDFHLLKVIFQRLSHFLKLLQKVGLLFDFFEVFFFGFAG